MPSGPPPPWKRSVPACAGEPGDARQQVHGHRVYPRVCGGTSLYALDDGDAVGLSPRVRGNPWSPHRHLLRGWSIPACAGEPRRRGDPASGGKVYPRVCGGTALYSLPSALTSGLSPRVRGNRQGDYKGGATGGSIPACAGEPGVRLTWYTTPGVYPRVCGGTWTKRIRRGFRRGLSPRVRGNLWWAICRAAAQGSIPACAGEPGRAGTACAKSRVYPRVCGGTAVVIILVAVQMGLSPHTRGNPWPFDNASCHLIRQRDNGDLLAAIYQIRPSPSTVFIGRFPQRQRPPPNTAPIRKRRQFSRHTLTLTLFPE